MERSIDVIIPTYKPGKNLEQLVKRLQGQTVKPAKIILMNTEEKYMARFLAETELLARYDQLELHHVSETEFDHGRTRDLGVQYSSAPFFLCMTQDALPKDDRLIEKLMDMLEAEEVGAVYARQLAGKESDILESFTRKFNYPEKDCIKRKENLEQLGIKTYFCSNVCAAYKREIYDALGGFIKKTIFNEDMIYGAALIQAGYAIGYASEAQVYHSHHYTGKQQFHRNFDLGVSQADHPEVFAAVPSEKEGGRLVKETLGFLMRKRKWGQLVPFVYQCGCKYIGYRMGKAYRRLPKPLVYRFSMNKNYWQTKDLQI